MLRRPGEADLLQPGAALADPFDKAYGFSYTYTECTNSCTDTVFYVVFIVLPGGLTFWLKTEDLDAAIAASITVD